MSSKMTLQDFACAISDLIWGGELAWQRKGVGLEALFNEVKRRLQQREAKRVTALSPLRDYSFLIPIAIGTVLGVIAGYFYLRS